MRYESQQRRAVLIVLALVFISGPFFWNGARIAVRDHAISLAENPDELLGFAENVGTAVSGVLAAIFGYLRIKGMIKVAPEKMALGVIAVYTVLLLYGSTAGSHPIVAMILVISMRIPLMPYTNLLACLQFGSITGTGISTLVFLIGDALFSPFAGFLAADNASLSFFISAMVMAPGIVLTALLPRKRSKKSTAGEEDSRLPLNLLGSLVVAYSLLQLGYFGRETFSFGILEAMSVPRKFIGVWGAIAKTGEIAVALPFLFWPVLCLRVPSLRRLGINVNMSATFTGTALLLYAATTIVISCAGSLPNSVLLTAKFFEGIGASSVERSSEGLVFSVFEQLKHGDVPMLLFDAFVRMIPIGSRLLLSLGLNPIQANFVTAVLMLCFAVALHPFRKQIARLIIVSGGGYK